VGHQGDVDAASTAAIIGIQQTLEHGSGVGPHAVDLLCQLPQ
jgi:hypothetical protein